MNRLILYLLRKKLGVKKNQQFRFSNQKSLYTTYSIDSKGINKILKDGRRYESNVPLDFLLSSDCEVIKVEQ